MSPTVTENMSKLTLQTGPAKATTKKPAVVADSWEDEDVSSDDERSTAARPTVAVHRGDIDSPTETPIDVSAKAGINAPPPTPISPLPAAARESGRLSPPPASYYNDSGHQQQYDSDGPAGSSSSSASSSSSSLQRPEKTDAVARRMIASALGVKAPRQTEEQKAYDRAMREKEKKRREEKKERQRREVEEKERAKQAVWDD